MTQRKPFLQVIASLAVAAIPAWAPAQGVQVRPLQGLIQPLGAGAVGAAVNSPAVALAVPLTPGIALPAPAVFSPVSLPAPLAPAAGLSALPSPEAFENAWGQVLGGLSTEPGRAAGERMGGVVRSALEEVPKPDQPLAVEGAVPAAQPAVETRLKAPITVKGADGVERPLSYNPNIRKASLGRRFINAVRDLPDKVKRVWRFTRQVGRLIEEITDEDLSWSLSRLKLLKSQEGILRSDNAPLVNSWKYRADWIKRMSPADLAPSSLDAGGIAFLFKQSMDREQPTLQYQFTSAHNLHNHLPRVSHFMGTTLQERVLQVALKGKAGQMAIWSTEEVRHGPIMQRVYEAVRPDDRPPLAQQGIASKQPETGEYSARSMMANRALAEIGAGTAYLTIKANMAYGSPAERVLDGIYRDEVYHYVIMSAVNKWAYGQRSRWRRLAAIIMHSFDYPTPDPVDAVIHERRFPGLLALFELGYAFMAIDGKVDRFLRKLDDWTALDWIGPVYRTDKDVQDAIARGEHTWTPDFRSEQNPELGHDAVLEMERRFPGYYSLANRALRASDIRRVIETYRKTQLRNPRYWLRKKGFYEAGPGALKRDLPGSRAGRIRLDFDEDGRVQTSIWDVSEPDRPVLEFTAGLENMSMPQIGALMDAESLDVVSELREGKPDLPLPELIARLSRSGGSEKYRKNPMGLIEDGGPIPDPR